MIYRRELIKRIVSNDRPVPESLKALNLKEMTNLAGHSWHAVSALIRLRISGQSCHWWLKIKCGGLVMLLLSASVVFYGIFEDGLTS